MNLKYLVPTTALAGATMLLAACGTTSSDPAAQDATASPDAHASDVRVALAYDGGLLVLDGDSLETIADLRREGFLRVNSAGDTAGHVFVTTPDGFQVLDTGLSSGAPDLTDVIYPAELAGHVTPHHGRTALFADGTGDITLFDTDAVSATEMADTETIASEAAHHGVAIELSDGTVLSTLGTDEGRSGVRVLDGDREEIARNEECPGVHGEGALANDVVMFGCEDGVLLYANGEFVKLSSPDEFGRVGNAYVTEDSAIAVGDYRNDPDLEGYLLNALVFVDTEAMTLDVVDLPAGASYTWRDVGRDEHGNVVVLASDGMLYVLDDTGEVTDSWEVIAPWESPAEWQDAHPALSMVGDIAYVTEPAARRVIAVDVHSGDVIAETVLDHAPHEIVTVGATSGH